MSTFRQTVRRHWQTYRPREWAALEAPEEFVQAKAREIEAAILEAEEVLEQTVPAATEYEERAGQLRQIRASATDQVLREMLPEPEPEPEVEAPPEISPQMRDLQAMRDAVYDL